MPLDNRTKKEIRKLIEDYLDEYSTDNQYGISAIPFHTHNGTDAPLITALPNSLDASQNEWQFNGVFSPSSNTVTAWGTGTLIFGNGDSFDITAGTTGTMSDVTYVYFDRTVSETAFQTASSRSFGGTSSGSADHFIVLSPDGKYEYVAGADGIKKYDDDLKLIASNTSLVFSGTPFAISSNGSFIYIVTSAGVVHILNALTLASTLSSSISVEQLFISPDNVYLYGTSTTFNTLHKIQTSDLTEPVSSVVTGNLPLTVLISPTGATLYLLNGGGAVGNIQRYNSSNLTTIGAAVNNRNNPAQMVLSPDGTSIFVSYSGSAFVDKYNSSVVLQTSSSSLKSSMVSITISSNGTYVYSVSTASPSPGTFYKLNASDLTTVTSHLTPFTVDNIDAHTKDSGFFYSANRDTTIQKIQTSDLTPVIIQPLIVSPNTTIIAVTQNVATGKNAIFEIFGGDALNGSGKIITSADMDGILTGITSFGLRDTSAAFDVTITATSAPILTAGRTLTIDMSNVAHTLDFGTTANTITFPSVASDTVVMLTASQAITGKTYNGLTLTSTTGTFTLTNAKTLTVSDSTTLATNSITFAGGEVVTFTATNALTLTTTGSTNVTLPTSGILAKTTDITITNAESNDSITPVADATYTFDKAVNNTIAITTKKGIITNVVIT